MSTEYMLFMGQSWAYGGQLGGPWGIPASVTMWNNTGGINSPTTGLGTAFVPATQNANPFYNNPSGPGNNTAAQMCKYLCQEMGIDIGLIGVWMGGQSITQWISATGVIGPLYTRMLNILAAAGVTKVKRFGWSQGHADAANYTTYAAIFNLLLSRMESDGIIDSDTPIVISELDITNPNMNTVLRGIANSSPRIGIADVSGFQVLGDPTNGYHPTGIGHVRGGLEFAREFMKLEEFFDDEELPNPLPYVTAIGSAQYSLLANGSEVKIPVKAENGDKSWISSGGVLIPYTGVYKIRASGFAWSGTYAVDIINQNSELLCSMAAINTGGVGAHCDGVTTMAFGAGDQLFLGAHADAASTVSAISSSTFNRLTVEFLGRD